MTEDVRIRVEGKGTHFSWHVPIWWAALSLAISASMPATAEVPSACHAAGFDKETFGNDFPNDNRTFDEHATYGPGYKWYRWNWFGVKPNLSLARHEPDGSLSARGGFEGHITSAAKIAGTPGFVGTAFGGGACVEVWLRFDTARADDGAGHPSFWAMSKEHLDGGGEDRFAGAPSGFSHFAEWDILEYYKIPAPGFLSSWIDWYGPYIPKNEVKIGNTVCRRPYCKRAKSFDFKATRWQTDWHHWQKVTGVWVPASPQKSGYIQTFLNGRPIAPPYSWPATTSKRMTIEDWLDFSVIDKQHMVLVISGGTKPIFIRSMRVFQHDSTRNLVN